MLLVWFGCLLFPSSSLRKPKKNTLLFHCGSELLLRLDRFAALQGTLSGRFGANRGPTGVVRRVKRVGGFLGWGGVLDGVWLECLLCCICA